jgi:hypothetical protein
MIAVEVQVGEDDVCERQEAGMFEVFMDNASGLPLHKFATKVMNA